MPTALPVRPAPERRLSWPQVARLWLLVARARLLDRRLNTLAGRRGRGGAHPLDDDLLRLARRWLACHEAIGALLPGAPEPEHVGRVRAILVGADQSSIAAD